MSITNQAPFESEHQLFEYAKQLIGKRISDIHLSVEKLDKKGRKFTKGVIAKVIETDFFDIPTNSQEEPDFRNLGIELKVSPLKPVCSRSLINPKERNVIGMVDYFDIYNKKSWQDNTRLSCKLHKVLFVFYLHDKAKNATEWPIISAFLWTPNKIQKRKIQEDYEIIREKVIAGKPNSEKDNKFLATCPKHQGGFKTGNPNARCAHPVMKYAERRAFCLRNDAVLSIISDSLGFNIIQKGNSKGFPITTFDTILGDYFDR